MNFRFKVLLVAAIFSSGPALAGPKEDVLHDFSQCAEIRNAASRLACFDSLTPRVKSLVPRPAVAPAPNVASAPPPAAATEQESGFGHDMGPPSAALPEQQTTPEQFGSERLPSQPESGNAPEELDKITAGVSEVAFTVFGKFIVFLDNGQIWRQLEGDSGHAHFRKNPKSNKVTISRGLLGSYNLTVNGSNALFKVTRVK